MITKPYINFLALILLVFTSLNAYPDDRSDEIRQRMWAKDEAFDKTEIPEKWADESAVIIAKLNRFEYKKPPVTYSLHSNSFFHIRIKLNDKNAVNEYSELSYPTNRWRSQKVYVGFKIIKPDGKEIIIDESEAVEMEMKENGVKDSYMKLAVPNLEVGDIIDYYICRDKIINLASQMYFFSPVLYNLPQEYPVIQQKLEFSVQRRCFISLRSTNGAPELKMEYDETTEEQQYTLIDENREAVKGIRWFYPNRELPSVKFRAAYASGKAIRQTDVFLGEPGKVKDHVTKKEISDFVSFMILNSSAYSKDLVKYVKKNTDERASNFEKATAGYYYLRNQSMSIFEVLTVGDTDLKRMYTVYSSPRRFEIQKLRNYSGFLQSLKIPHDIVITIPRYLSSLDDMLLENELMYLIRVKQGNEYLYFSFGDQFKIPGEYGPQLQGAEAYVLDGLAKPKDWNPTRITIPATDKQDNKESVKLNVNLSEDLSKTNIDITRTISGNFKSDYQDLLLDYYDYDAEERERYEMAVDFSDNRGYRKKLLNLRESYMSTRDKNREELLKLLAEREYDFEIEAVSDFQLDQTGRYDDKPELIYQFKLETEDIVSKVGTNYLLNIGKLIESQVKIEADELERNHSIFMESPRTYSYDINVEIPNGYSVQGLENLKNDIENGQGGFISSAEVKDDVLTVKTSKFYKNVKADKDAWEDLVKFLNAAHKFTEQKVLLKKTSGT